MAIQHAATSFSKSQLIVNKKRVELYFSKAQRAYNDGEFDNALRLIEQALQEYSASEKLYYWYGKILYRLKLYDNAQEAFEKAQEINPNHWKSYYRLIKTYLSQGNVVQASKMMEAPAKHGFVDLDLYLNLVKIFLQYDAHETIAKILGFVAAQRIENVEYMRESAIHWMKAHDYDQAIVMFDQLLSRDPDNFQSQYNKSICLLKVEKIGEAVDILESLRCSPVALEQVTEERILNQLAKAYRLIENYSKSVEILQHLAELFPDDIEYVMAQTECALKTYDLKKAKHTFEKVLSIDSKDERAHMGLSRLKIMSYQYEASRKLKPALQAPILPEESCDRSGEGVDVVMFFVQTSASPTPFVSDNYTELMCYAVDAVKSHMKLANIVMLTDQRTQFSDDIGFDKIIRFDDVHDETMIYDCMKAQLEYLKQTDNNVIFIDTDIIITKDLTSMFAQDFAVGVTWRTTHSFMPMNAGVIFVNQFQRKHAIHFFEKTLDCLDAVEQYGRDLKEFNTGIRHWWGDQLSVSAYIGWENLVKRPSNLIEVDGADIWLLPCAIFNYAMTEKSWHRRKDLKDKAILHFKGDSKRYIADYNEFISIGNKQNILQTPNKRQ